MCHYMCHNQRVLHTKKLWGENSILLITEDYSMTLLSNIIKIRGQWPSYPPEQIVPRDFSQNTNKQLSHELLAIRWTKIAIPWHTKRLIYVTSCAALS